MIPNLEKLEKKAKNIALTILKKEKGLESYQAIDADIKVWRQLWSDTSCGTSKTENYISGCAMTYGYMTVIIQYLTFIPRIYSLDECREMV